MPLLSSKEVSNAIGTGAFLGQDRLASLLAGVAKLPQSPPAIPAISTTAGPMTTEERQAFNAALDALRQAGLIASS